MHSTRGAQYSSRFAALFMVASPQATANVGSGGPRARSELPCSLALRKNVKDVTTADGSRGGCRTRAPRSRSR